MIFRTFLVFESIVEGNRSLLELQAQSKLHIAWSQCRLLLQFPLNLELLILAID